MRAMSLGLLRGSIDEVYDDDVYLNKLQTKRFKNNYLYV
jgi:hypothetical protein